MTNLFPTGYKGLSDSKHSGIEGSVYRSVGIDAHSTPGIIKAHQKLTKNSGTVVDELCKHAISTSDGSNLWFSSESGKIWRESAGTYTLVHTTSTSNVSFYTNVQDDSSLSADNTVLLTDDTSLTNDCTKIAQMVRFIEDTEIDAVEVYLREIGGLNGSYSLKLSIQENDVNNNSGQPDGVELASITQVVSTGSIQSDRHAPYNFVLDNTYTFTANKLYWIVIEVTDYTAIDPTEAVSVSVSEEVENHFAKRYVASAWTSSFESGSPFIIRAKLKRSVDREVALDNLTLGGLDSSVGLSADLTSTFAEAFGQSVVLTEDKTIDTVVFNLFESTIDGGYSLKVSIETDDNGVPSGVEIGSVTDVISSGDITADVDEFAFTFANPITLYADTKYWVIIKPTNLSDITQSVDNSYLGIKTGTSSYSGGALLAYRDINTDSTHALDLERTSSQSVAIADGSQTGLDITGDLTIEAEILPETTPPNNGDEYVIASKSRTDGNQRGYRFYIENVSSVFKLKLDISTDGTAVTTATVDYAGPSTPSTQRQHVAVVYDASAGSAEFFINGVKTGTTQTGLATSIYNNTANFTLGADNHGAVGAPANFFDGLLNDVRVWNVTRTEAQILANKGNELVGNESGLVGYWKFNNDYLDTTSNNNDLTATNSPVFSALSTNKWTTRTADATDITTYDMEMALKLVAIDSSTYGEVKCLGAEEFDNYIYWATEKLLNRIALDKITTANDWTDHAEIGFGEFLTGSTSNHPMVKQNLQLFIGDAQGIAKVNEDGEFERETQFLLKEPEVITAMTEFDIDVLVGTENVGLNKARTLRWNTEGESWSAEDDIEARSVNAFIKDDNYVYIQAGDFGDLYFYNGEKMEPFKKIQGDYSPTKKAIVNSKSVATLYGIPRFGLSNLTGNPTLEGVYSLGSYSKDYPKVADLSYPISTDTFTDLSLGAILVRDGDLFVSWKTTGSAGIDKIDYTTKYASAYFETMILTPPNERGVLKTLKELTANYALLPANTGITFGVKKNYENDYVSQTSKTDTKLNQIRVENSIPDVSALQIKVSLTTSSNSSPEIEDCEYHQEKPQR